MTPDEIRALAFNLDLLAGVLKEKHWGVSAGDASRAAAALRELVEDRERLDWLDENPKSRIIAEPHVRAAIDAALRELVEERDRWRDYARRRLGDVSMSPRVPAALCEVCAAAMRAAREEPTR